MARGLEAAEHALAQALPLSSPPRLAPPYLSPRLVAEPAQRVRGGGMLAAAAAAAALASLSRLFASEIRAGDTLVGSMGLRGVPGWGTSPALLPRSLFLF